MIINISFTIGILFRSSIGAVLLSQWCQPTQNITETVVSGQLDEVAKGVITELAVQCPEHPAVKRGTEFSVKGKGHVIRISLPNFVEAKMVLRSPGY